jgi:cytidylate kinase
MIQIAVDGPSGAGKSTLAKAVAAKLGIVYVDTGALYRSIGLYILRCGIASDDKENIVSKLGEIKLELVFSNGEQHVYLNGEDVGAFIRTPEVSKYASDVSAIPEVRAFLLDTQRNIANTNSVIMDGRDIGTVILPDADVKIFLTASSDSRAIRRYEELKAKGMEVDLEQIRKSMSERDKNDSGRKVAPAIPAEDATFLDNSGMSLEQTLAAALDIITEKLGDKI